MIQAALSRYIRGNNSDVNWARAIEDLQIGLGTGGANQYLLQAKLYGPDETGVMGRDPVFSTTSNSTVPITLPQNYENGAPIVLGDGTAQGYPEYLYPRLQFQSRVMSPNMTVMIGSFEGIQVNRTAPLIVGPYQINNTFALASITVPVVDNTSIQVLGWMTIAFSCELIYLVVSSVLGLGSSGVNLLVSPDTRNNRLQPDLNVSSSPVRFIVPPVVNRTRESDRHPGSEFHVGPAYTFTYEAYPAVQSVFAMDQHTLANAGSHLDSVNEKSARVAVGFALVDAAAVDWAVIVEESYAEVHAPIDNLRKVLLACIFGTIGAIVLIIFPLAHYSVRPIRALRDATNKTVDPYEFSDPGDHHERNLSQDLDGAGNKSSFDEEEQALAKKEGLITRLNPFVQRKQRKLRDLLDDRKFRIPAKVNDGKHIITDELTDLTTTFNGMCDELMMQYARLEERVKERTLELELSKKAAEAANESKTLFIANISHELKTPLNGILGMCAVSMSEDDPSKIKKSLNIIYKSGELLLNLLTDLLTFTRNQIGQHLTLDEKEFRLADISSQVLSIFDKQRREGQISLDLVFEGPNTSLDTASGNPGQPGYGPFGTGRVKDMCVWGDQHRILQVVINLVSNSLKFTPPGGAVTVRVRCTGEVDPAEIQIPERKNSTLSRHSKTSSASRVSRPRSGRSAKRSGSSASSIHSADPSSQARSDHKEKDAHTALEINSREPKTLASIDGIDRSSIGPPLNTRILLFDFEVEDTGPGIPPAQQKKIFEPFVQGDLGLNKKYGGTGLGLSICSQLASLMKGRISLHSVEGKGSIFTMQIPLG